MTKSLLCMYVLLLLGLSSPTRAAVEVEAGYSEPANLFSVMDNVSGWLPGFTNPAYREEWTRRFGWSKADQAWVERYAEYRNRTFSDPTQGILPASSPDGMFAPATANTTESDPLGAYLLGQGSVASALANLKDLGSPADAKMLEGFYQHFAPKWRVILTESLSLQANAKVLNAQLQTPGNIAFVDRAARFYQVSLSGRFQSFFVWHPPGDRSSAEVLAGRYFLIHVSPAQAGSNDWDSIAMHELMHYISSQQNPEQKQSLTKQFLAKCPQANRPRALQLFEEPLAVAWGQAAYAKFVTSKPLNWSESWYAAPTVDLLGHMLWPVVDQLYNSELTIGDGIVDQAANQCATFSSAAKAAQPK